MVPLAPSTAPYKSGDNNSKHPLSRFSLNNVPLSPNFGRTLHRFQGCTEDSIQGMEWSKSDDGRVFQPMMLYILLSRVRTLNGLYLHKEITWEDITAFNDYLPPFKVEQDRLRALELVSQNTYPLPNVTDPAPFDDSTIPALAAERRAHEEAVRTAREAASGSAAGVPGS